MDLLTWFRLGLPGGCLRLGSPPYENASITTLHCWMLRYLIFTPYFDRWARQFGNLRDCDKHQRRPFGCCDRRWVL